MSTESDYLANDNHIMLLTVLVLSIFIVKLFSLDPNIFTGNTEVMIQLIEVIGEVLFLIGWLIWIWQGTSFDIFFKPFKIKLCLGYLLVDALTTIYLMVRISQ